MNLKTLRAKKERNQAFYSMQAALDEANEAEVLLQAYKDRLGAAQQSMMIASESFDLARLRLRAEYSTSQKNFAPGANPEIDRHDLKQAAQAFNAGMAIYPDSCPKQTSEQRARSPNRKLVGRDIQARFRSAKAKYNEAERLLQQAKAQLENVTKEHEQARNAYTQARSKLEAAKQLTIQTNLDYVELLANARSPSAYNAMILNMERAQKAGVPPEYHGNLWVTQEENGNINILFGGKNKPNGEGHAHYVLELSGAAKRIREIGEERPPEHIRKAAALRNRITKGIHTSVTDS